LLEFLKEFLKTKTDKKLLTLKYIARKSGTSDDVNRKRDKTDPMWLTTLLQQKRKKFIFIRLFFIRLLFYLQNFIIKCFIIKCFIIKNFITNFIKTFVFILCYFMFILYIWNKIIINICKIIIIIIWNKLFHFQFFKNQSRIFMGHPAALIRIN